LNDAKAAAALLWGTTPALHHLHLDPVKRRLVRDPKQWPWSSYRFYSGESNLLRMDPV